MTPKTAGRVGNTLRRTDQNAQTRPVTAGLVSDARVLMPKGEQAVQHLRIGDALMTRDCGPVPIRDIEVRSIVTPVVYIIAGSIGHTCLHRDTLLSADQTVLLTDWRARAVFGQNQALVRADALVDGEFVRTLGLHVVTLYRIYCDRPHIFFADGLALGTADCGAVLPLGKAA